MIALRTRSSDNLACCLPVSILECSQGPISLTGAGAPPPALLAQGCRSLALGGAAAPRFPPAGHPNAAAALGTPAPRAGRRRRSPHAAGVLADHRPVAPA